MYFVFLSDLKKMYMKKNLITGVCLLSAFACVFASECDNGRNVLCVYE